MKSDKYKFKNNWPQCLNKVKQFYKSNKISPLFIESENDPRPYLEIKINNNIFSGLLDTGAMQCVLGKPGYNIISKMNLTISKI